MNWRSNNFRFFILWALTIMGMTACDTANNVEDPDLHYFVKYYGGDGNQFGVDIQTLNDGSLLLLGNYKESNFDTDLYLVRVDPKGEVIWEKRIGEDLLNNIFNAKDLEPTNDGNFILLADFQKDIGERTQLNLLKISPDGALLDSVSFGTPANDFGRSVTLVSDGGFIVSGTTEFTGQWTPTDPGLDPGDTFGFRFDQNLNPYSPWGPNTAGFGAGQGVQLDVAVRTIEIPPPTPDDSVKFYVFGHTNSNISGNNSALRQGLFYFQRGSSGTEATPLYPDTNIDNTEIQFAQRVAPELGTGFVAVGTRQNPLGFSDIFFARFRSSLTFQQASADILLSTIIPLGRNIRGVSLANSVVGGAGYLVLGNEVRGTGAVNFWLSKIDQSGKILWSSTFGSEEGDDSAAGVVELPDGKVVVLGTMGLADNQFKMAVIKLNPSGQLLK